MAPLEAQRAWEAQAQLQKLEAQVRQQQEQVAQVPGDDDGGGEGD